MTMNQAEENEHVERSSRDPDPEAMARTRARLLEALDSDETTLKDVMKIFTGYVVARRGTLVHAAKQLKIDRRTIQRWGCARP